MSAEEIDVTQKLKDLFSNLDINLNINNQILDKDLSFYKSLAYYFNLVLQLRNSDTKNDIDYLICPNCNFHSKD
jgi:CRISPR-associated protein Cpf1